MKWLRTVPLALISLVLLSGGNCSRARVESMNLMNEGVVLAQQKRYAEAVEQLERATGVDPTNDQAFYQMAIVHMEMRKFARAKDDLQSAININAEKAGYHEKLGTVLIELEDWPAAKDAFAKALQLDSSLFKAHFKLGQVYEQLDNEQEALHQYTKAIEKGPRFLEAYATLGRLYADLGYLDHAAQVLQSALKVAQSGTEEEARVHHLLGTVYQQQKKYGDAVKQFRAALEVVPGMADALFSLGWTYSLTDNREEARRFLKKYVEIASAEAPQHYVKAARDRVAELEEGP